MAIPGIQNINIGLPNESIGSDSLFTAFTKTSDNFDTLFSCASPTTSFVAGNGISTSLSNGSTILNITNTGVTSLTAGDSSITLTRTDGDIVITASLGNTNGSTAVVIGSITGNTLDVSELISGSLTVGTYLIGDGIAAETYITAFGTGGGGNGNYTITPSQTIGSTTITGRSNYIGVSNVNVIGASGNARITASGGPIISTGTITLDLANSGVSAGTYTYPTLTVDSFGRITSANSGNSVGTVTSIGLITSGSGIQLSGSPITSSGNITIINTGVTRLSAGSGINLTASNGNVTVSAVNSGTVTGVTVSSSTLSITNNSITTVGTIGIDLSPDVPVTGKLTLSGAHVLTNGGAANLSVTAEYFSTTGAWTSTLAAGTAGQIKTFMMVVDGGDMVTTVTNAGWKSSGTGTITFNDIGDGCTLQYINSKWFCIGQNGVTFG
jgi:hypothetical protein